LRSCKRAALVALILSLIAIPASGPALGEGAATAAAASYQCTPWASQTKPPETIWVHIPVKKGRRWKMGTRVQVDFKTYVERVVINEWGPNEVSRAQLLSAAQVVKQYAWWYITHPNKKLKDKHGDCFDIGSTTAFQLYRADATAKQEKADAQRIKKGIPARLPLIRSAIEAIWPLSIWKTSGTNKGFAYTSYRGGKYKAGCAKYYTGFRLYQQNARRCAEEGESFEDLIRRFYGPNVAIYAPLPAEGDTAQIGYEADPFVDPWSLPDGWSNSGDQLTEFRGDFNGDLFPEIATVRVWNTINPANGRPIVSAAMGSIERRDGAYSWRDGIWRVPDLTAFGIDPTQMQIMSADLNGDGSDDLVITAPAPTDREVPGGGQTGIWVALSEQQNWVKKRIQDPILGEPQLVASASASLSDLTLLPWDHNADGQEEIAIITTSLAGGLNLSLLSTPRGGAMPSLALWWNSDAMFGNFTPGDFNATTIALGPQRDASSRRRIPRSELILSATLGGQHQTIAISGATPGVASVR